MKYEILDGVLEYNVCNLQPDTQYSVQVAGKYYHNEISIKSISI